jgi:dihydroxyacetone kinase
LLLETLGEEIGDVETPSGPAVARAVRKGAQAVEDSGGAQLGDKTLLDALWPFVDALGELAPRHSVGTAWSLAAVVADTAAAATAALRPKVGRARPLADRSLGSPDPGAVSLALCLNAVGTVLVARTAHPRARAEHGSPAPAVSGA